MLGQEGPMGKPGEAGARGERGFPGKTYSLFFQFCDRHILNSWTNTILRENIF